MEDTQTTTPPRVPEETLRRLRELSSGGGGDIPREILMEMALICQAHGITTYLWGDKPGNMPPMPEVEFDSGGGYQIPSPKQAAARARRRDRRGRLLPVR